ncbi:uncharacterized protein PV06_02879 [Exophiala oligosperma]|uniref:Zn(2)-C6 fungal-type domain-containing protein n=1 Tax=Exophiala oligosperma TaxID=215243 RepID=A0A0D2C3R2_9EURO|nr:uncharacterized protein PV06_02879 [Exophiala oligosperma]KIW44407.1 hypothetical protein PV06_02879 [Exophiala oligosperma]
MGRSSDRTAQAPQPNRVDEKRRLEDGDEPTSVRSKRRGNECKRRKVKCSGSKPCQRCDNLSLDCVFTRSYYSNSIRDNEEFIQMRNQIAFLQNQINDLSNSRSDPSTPPVPNDRNEGHLVASSMSKTLRTVPAGSPGLVDTDIAQFHGPTSSMYGFDIANSTLQSMGITPAPSDPGPLPETRSTCTPPKSSLAIELSGDPLWAVNQAEAIRLCKVYDEEIGIMYPHIDMAKVFRHVHALFTCTHVTISVPDGSGQLYFQGTDPLDNEDVIIVKMVVAIGLLLVNSGKSDLSQQLYDSIQDNINAKILSALSIRSVTLFILTAHFHFQKDEEAQAWRFIGIAARLCLEMGLHRSENISKSFPDEADRLEAVRNFWVVYALDRRYSFGTGLPFALQDQHLDRSLPGPDNAFPYLKHITEFNHIAGKVWHENMVYKPDDKDRRDAVAFLDYQILQWYSQLPESLTFSKDLLVEQRIPRRGARRLRFLMYLRKNQARMSVYRPILYSATSIRENRQLAQEVVDVAKDTILTISSINEVSDLYSTQQVCYNYFLVQAMAVIFLAVCHAPADFCDQTRDEFCTVVELIKGFNTSSYIAKRVWQTIRRLREIGDKIGLLARRVSEPGHDAQPHDAAAAAAAVAGLSAHHHQKMDDPFSLEQPHAATGHELDCCPEDGYQMSGELTSLFALAGEYSGLGLAMGDDDHTYADGDGPMGNNGQGMSALLGSQQEFARTLEQLF